MYCRNCGNQIDDKAVICPRCGAAVYPNWQVRPQYQGTPVPSVGFLEAVKLFFTRYADFKGRSRRSEYWWVSLLSLLLFLVWFILFGFVIAAQSEALVAVFLIVSLAGLIALFVPSLAVTIRRLHDTGRSGWWYLMSFIPSVGSIILTVLCCLDSEPDNQWGPNPKYTR